MKRICRTVFTSMAVVTFLLTILLSFSSCSVSDDGAVIRMFGYGAIQCHSSSMEPTFENGDWIIVQEQDASNLEAGEIISFWGFVDGQQCVFTHRICEVITLKDGACCYQTKGDNNALADQDPYNMYQQPYVYPEDIIGVYVTHF